MGVHADGIEEEEKESFLFFTIFFETPKKVQVFFSPRLLLSNPFSFFVSFYRSLVEYKKKVRGLQILLLRFDRNQVLESQRCEPSRLGQRDTTFVSVSYKLSIHFYDRIFI